VSTPGELRVATLNVRNTADGWSRRRPLLVDQLVELKPDVIGLQELRSIRDQGATITRAAERRSGGRLAYQSHRTYKTGLWGFWEGLGTLTCLPIVDRGSLGLGGQNRVAQRVTVQLPQGAALEVYNTHLASGDESLRTAQAGRLLEWMEPGRGRPQVLLGDFNAGPGSPTVDLITGTSGRPTPPSTAASRRRPFPPPCGWAPPGPATCSTTSS